MADKPKLTAAQWREKILNRLRKEVTTDTSPQDDGVSSGSSEMTPADIEGRDRYLMSLRTAVEPRHEEIPDFKVSTALAGNLADPVASDVGSHGQVSAAQRMASAQRAIGAKLSSVDSAANDQPDSGNVVRSGSGDIVKTGSGSNLRTRSANEFGGPLDNYRKMTSPTNENLELSDILKLSGQLTEKAHSKQQQKFMGMVSSLQSGDSIKNASPELKKAAKTMSKKDVKDFASTKHAGLPRKVTEGIMLDESGYGLKHITNRFKYETKMFVQSGHMDRDLYNALFDYYHDTGEMPYSVEKSDNPRQWVEERFYSDIGSGMNEGFEMDLNELARLAGLKTEGIGDAAAQTAGNMTGAMVKGAKNLAKGAGEMSDQFKMGMKDAEIGRKSYAVPTPDVDVKQVDPRGLGAKVLPKNSDTPTATPWLNECGDMGMSREQPSSMNISTNMSSDGTKSVTVSAQGDQAEALVDMLRLAGMKHDHISHEEPVTIISSDDEEVLGESGLRLYHKEHSYDGIYMAKVYKDPEWNEFVVKYFKMGKPLPSNTWYHTDDIEDAVSTAQSEIESMGKRDGGQEVSEEYANEPDEEYHSIDSITTQGDDLNRQKRQYPSKPRLGDNPMTLDEELESLLNGVLVRPEEDIEEGVLDTVTNVAGKVGSAASNFVGDLVGTEASALRNNEQLRQIDANRKATAGTPEGDIWKKKYDDALVRHQTGQGQVTDYDPKTGKTSVRQYPPVQSAPKSPSAPSVPQSPTIKR